MEEVEQTLHALSTREPETLVTKLPRQAGQKDARFAHLLCGPVAVEEIVDEQAVRKTARPANESEELGQRVDELATEVESLRRQFEEFKKQFE